MTQGPHTSNANLAYNVIFDKDGGMGKGNFSIATLDDIKENDKIKDIYKSGLIEKYGRPYNLFIDFDKEHGVIAVGGRPVNATGHPILLDVYKGSMTDFEKLKNNISSEKKCWKCWKFLNSLNLKKAKFSRNLFNNEYYKEL